mgnify:CR=1 FL=1|jgi:hypothetical protein
MPPDLRLGHLVFEAHRTARWIRLKPKLRLQLKMAAGLIKQKTTGAPRQAKELA